MSFFAPALEGSKPEQYAQLNQQLSLLIGSERDSTANMANTAALIFHQLPGLNWAGFYLMKDGELVLGPFQGKPACIRIPLGKGVCGTAAATRETQLVPDVHAFPGHIACDADSRSEIVVPLVSGGRLIGVLDLDSPNPARFDEADRAGLEALGGLLITSSDWGD
ncbi:MAG: GAF domain-containing protein [Sandarakinorhabdus sp.]|jgi:GAF domain-containing protein|nr:GAF domain-containing protein [Sandarakinorhabdus sp.]